MLVPAMKITIQSVQETKEDGRQMLNRREFLKLSASIGGA